MLLASEPSPEMFGSLPNITGTSKYQTAVLPTDPYQDGALKTQSRGTGDHADIGGGFLQTIVTLDASLGSSYYVASAKPQVASIQALVCIKT